LVWTKPTTSGRMGALNTAGRVVCPTFSPASSYTVIKGLAALNQKQKKTVLLDIHKMTSELE